MASFNTFYPMLNELEGGYQNLKSDSGNKNSKGEYVGTNRGISARFYEQIKGFPPSKNDMLNITKQEARSLYKQHFWDKLKADQINSQAAANTIVDMQVNSGRGARIAQEVLKNIFNKNIAIDGVIGRNTLAAINSVDANDFVKAYNAARVDYYESIGNPAWLKIWLKRVQRFAVNNSAAISLTGVLFLTALGVLIYKNI